MFLIEQYEAQGIDVFDKDGNMKSLDALREESIEKDLQDRAEAGLRK